MKNTFFKAILTGAFMTFGSAGSLTAAECIAPANPGGGWDFTCRTITKIMYDIGAVDSPIQVTNMAGGGGGLAYAHVVNERNNVTLFFTEISKNTNLFPTDKFVKSRGVNNWINLNASGPVISTCLSTATSQSIAVSIKFQKFCSGSPKSRGIYIWLYTEKPVAPHLTVASK